MGAGPVNASDGSPGSVPPRNFSTDDDVFPVLAKRSAPCMAEALPFQGGYRPPSRSFKDRDRMPDLNRLGCIGLSTGTERSALRARPAASSGRSGRQRRSTNRTAACVKVGVTGAKTGAAASVGGMMTTFDEFGEFWEMRRGDQILSPGRRDVADFCADVCSRQATRPVLMRLIGGRRKQHCRGVRMVYV